MEMQDLFKMRANINLLKWYGMETNSAANPSIAKGTYMRATKILKLTIIPPNSPEFLSECIQTCFQIRCSEACMKHSCCTIEEIIRALHGIHKISKSCVGHTEQSNEKCPEDCEKTAWGQPEYTANCNQQNRSVLKIMVRYSILQSLVFANLQKRTGQTPIEVSHKYESIFLSLVDHEEQGWICRQKWY